MSLAGSAMAVSPQLVVGHAAGAPVTVEDLQRHGAEYGDMDRLHAAIYHMRVELALADEARVMLGSRVSGTPRAEAATALLNHLFGPATCGRLPDRVMRERYVATRWRFVAPPAWSVEDLQLLCCEDARDCKRPEVTECVARRAPEAAALELALTSKPVEDGVLEQEMDRIRAQGRQAARSEYLFYYDPDHPEVSIDGRLQTVDDPIAKAVSGAKESTWIGPLSSRFGYHTLRLKRRRPGLNLPYDSPEVKALLITELCPAFMVDQRARYTLELIRTQAWSPVHEALEAAFGEAGLDKP